jgi:hypothetical protein
MVNSTFAWQPESNLWIALQRLAIVSGKSPEELINEAVSRYLEQQEIANRYNPESDALIGLFSGDPNLSTESEAILAVTY